MNFSHKEQYNLNLYILQELLKVILFKYRIFAVEIVVIVPYRV